METRQCKSCDNGVDAEHNFCNQCGCNSCGARVAAVVKICQACGVAVKRSNPIGAGVWIVPIVIIVALVLVVMALLPGQLNLLCAFAGCGP